MRNLIVILSLLANTVLLTNPTVAQSIPTLSNENVWQGDTPGRYTDWHLSSNWSKNHPPYEEEIVVIPDLSTKGNQYPIIKKEVIVRHLVIHTQAQLTILSTGKLLIDPQGEETFGLDAKGKIFNHGQITVIKEFTDDNEGLAKRQ